MDNISKIKDRLNVVDVISGYLKVQKAGINFKARCPFHNEKTPSFFISPERQIWHCFGCQKGGDIFAFVKEIEGVEFPEALRILAARAGVELEEFDPKAKDSKDRLYQVCETAARFFEKQRQHSNTGRQAAEYLKERGVADDTLAKFRLGFAPATWNSLTEYLRNSGFTEKEIVDAGMAIKRQPTTDNLQPTTGIYDRFRSRIMFPIADANGRVVGFTGRIFEVPTSDFDQASELDKGQSVGAKYINTPQTLIYDKSRILYGLNHSRNEIRKKNSCLLVEGNMDAIMSYQAGVENVVASSGTALTPSHLVLLKRFTENLDFCFDTDSAGALATKRGVGLALGQGFNVKIISIDDKECKDPADYVQKYKNKWAELVKNPKPIIEFYFDKAKENYNPVSAESKKNVVLVVAPFIKRLSSKVERTHWINQLAYFLKVKEGDVESDVVSAHDELSIYDQQPTTNNQQPTTNDVGSKSLIDSPDMLNEALLSLVMKTPTLFKEEIPTIDQKILNPLTHQVFTELVREDIDNFNFDNFVKKFDDTRTLDLEFAYLRAQALWEGFKDEELKTEFSSILNKLKQKNIHASLADISYEMRAAETQRDTMKIGELATKFNQLAKELADIHNS
ncbi:MAG: DNA primase [Patescibacteria group bacterium]